MRIATYNLESLDLPPRAKRSIEERVAMLAPELQRARADVVCLQEVNAQSDPGHHHRSLRALDRLLEDTPYTHYHRSVSEMNIGSGIGDVQSLIVLDRAIDEGRRFSVIHQGRPQMLDHILASRAMYGRFVAIEVHNEALSDEAVGYARVDRPTGSYHACVVAEFT